MENVGKIYFLLENSKTIEKKLSIFTETIFHQKL